MTTTPKNNRKIASVSWGDHLVFGEGDGRLSTPDALQRRMRCWHDEMGATALHWRQIRSTMSGHFFAEAGRKYPLEKIKNDLSKNFGSTIKLNYKYDPNLIGGLIIQVGSVMIATSIKNKLQQIENEMIEA